MNHSLWLNRFIAGRAFSGISELNFSSDPNHEDASTVLLNLSLAAQAYAAPAQVDMAAGSQSEQMMKEYFSQYLPQIEASASDASSVPSVSVAYFETGLVTCVEEATVTKPSNAEQIYAVIEGEPISGPVCRLSDSSDERVVCIFPLAQHDALSEFFISEPAICREEGTFDPLISIRQELKAALADGSDAAMDLFLARHPLTGAPTEASEFLGGNEYAIANGHLDWLL